MPRQNRVTPFGDLIATPERGTFMGNPAFPTTGKAGSSGPGKQAAGLICRCWSSGAANG